MKSEKRLSEIAEAAAKNNVHYIISDNKYGRFDLLTPSYREEDGKFSWRLTWLHEFTDFSDMCKYVTSNKNLTFQFISKIC